MPVCLLSGLATGLVVAVLAQVLPAAGGRVSHLRPAGLKQHIRRRPGWFFLIVAVTAILTCVFHGGGVGSGQMSALVRYVLVALFVLVAIIDIEHRRILLVPVILASAIALVSAMANNVLDSALAGGAVGLLVGYGMYLGGALYGLLLRRFQGVELHELPLGGGDTLLAGLCGLVSGWPEVITALLAGIVSAGATSLCLLLAGRVSRRTALPYAPHLLGGTLLVLYFPGLAAFLPALFG